MSPARLNCCLQTVQKLRPTVAPTTAKRGTTCSHGTRDKRAWDGAAASRGHKPRQERRAGCQVCQPPVTHLWQVAQSSIELHHGPDLHDAQSVMDTAWAAMRQSAGYAS